MTLSCQNVYLIRSDTGDYLHQTQRIAYVTKIEMEVGYAFKMN